MPPPIHCARRVLTTLVAHDVCGIPLVLANVLDQLCVRQQIECHRDAPRLSIGFRIVDGELNLEMPEVAAPISLDKVEGISRRVTPEIKPCVVHRSRRVDDERVAIPRAARVPEGRRRATFRDGSTVSEYLTIVIELLMENQGEPGHLDDLERLWNREGLRDAVR